ncbi:cupredoxin domain-containing protein [Halonotius pteroides]|uniref:hypothetical protein n=1 Tax=Halonotius pteroides TaxID=268735 RepID=UPI001058A8CB|nr:hypothetical protein [Halonotius pteroides]
MSDTASTGTIRRQFPVVAGTGGLAWSAGCVNVSVDSDSGEDATYDDYLSDANGYDGFQADGDKRYGVVRRVHTGRVQIKVGSPTDSGLFANRVGAGSESSGSIENTFLPAAIETAPGTTVEWVWIGDGGRYTVVAKDGSFASGYHTEQGATFTHTFEDNGVTRYHSVSHEEMKGVVDMIN